ncbi:MAG: toll/interleukin-1 receptor domain-containing protein [Chromatiales bacterium]|nr:toll/interleukin-1 receptor domain-containing protein [Chromatiales bacterium]
MQQAVSRSATLVVILSEGYLQSDWCRAGKEELFLQAAQRGGGIPGRLFVVQLTDIERSRWPTPFDRSAGLQILPHGRPNRAATHLKLNADDPKDRYYSQRIDDLSLDLAGRPEGHAYQATGANGHRRAGDSGALCVSDCRSDRLDNYAAGRRHQRFSRRDDPRSGRLAR